MLKIRAQCLFHTLKHYGASNNTAPGICLVAPRALGSHCDLARAGARLTAYELVHEGLPATLIADSAAAALMAAGKVDAVVVGADRVAANGDAANKIGTYSLAVNAAYHGCVRLHAAVTRSAHLGVHQALI